MLGATIKSVVNSSVQYVQLQLETLQAFEAYMVGVEHEHDSTTRPPGTFLWSDAEPARTRAVCKGSVVVESCAIGKPKQGVRVPDGLIHDWIGAVFAPNRTMQQALKVVQDYDNHHNTYAPEVLVSRVVSRCGDDFHIYLRLRKKKIITVVLDSYHDAHYSHPAAKRAICRSRSTKILEVQDPGTARETCLPADTGHGFLWRLNSYWRFAENYGGVVMECRAISLTRDVPTALAWIINPMVRKLPEESLANTLAATRAALITA